MNSGETAKIKFSKKGWIGKHDHKVEGKVLNAKGEAKILIHGNWN